MNNRLSQRLDNQRVQNNPNVTLSDLGTYAGNRSIPGAQDAIQDIGKSYVPKDFKKNFTLNPSFGSLCILQAKYLWKRTRFCMGLAIHASIVETIFDKLKPETIEEKLYLLEYIESEIKSYDAKLPTNQSDSMIRKILRYFGMVPISNDEDSKYREIVKRILSMNQISDKNISLISTEVKKQNAIQQPVTADSFLTFPERSKAKSTRAEKNLSNKIITDHTIAKKQFQSPPQGCDSSTMFETFKDHEGNELAKEMCLRAETTTLLQDELIAKIAYYKEKIYETKDPKEKLFFIKEACRFEKQLKSYEPVFKEPTKWASTNAHKTFFKKHVTNNPNSCDRLAPLLTNLRNQKVYDKNGKLLSSVNRSGAVTDFAHGEVSLQEMRDYGDLKKLEQTGFKNDVITELYELGNPIDEKKLRKTISSIEERIVLSYGNRVQEKSKRNGALTIDMQKLAEICIERQEKLNSQVLQDLMAHFSNRKIEGEDGAYVSITRIGLVNTNKKSDGENKEGKKRKFINSEKTQALDMKAIYDSFDGKTIVFEDSHKCKAPFIDEKGMIHLPDHVRSQESTANGMKTATLMTNFLNISVQLNTQNAGPQMAINNAALRKMKGRDPRTVKAILETLPKANKGSNSAHETAVDIVEVLQEKGHYVSIDCYGGKDRTGYVLALLTFRKLNHIKNNEGHDIVDSKSWKSQLLGKTGILRRVIDENAGHNIAKLVPFSPWSKEVSLGLFTPSSMIAMQLKGALVKVNAPKEPQDLYGG